ncbi:hypothetical protein ACE6H2_015527 [Prunus campanulata]
MAADYGGGVRAISLSQGGRNSDDDDGSSEHSPRSASGGVVVVGVGSFSSKSKFASPSGEIIMSKKPRGRPPGSKNKPKPPIVITKDSEAAVKPVVLEISAGSDVIEAIIQYARRRHVGISVLSGSGAVSNVTLIHPAGPHHHPNAPSLLSLLHGPFNLLSLSGSFMDAVPAAPTCSSSASSKVASAGGCSLLGSGSFGICLAGAQGQVFGGIVGGKVVAASAVVVVGATFVNPKVLRLPLPGDDHDDNDHVVEGGAPAAEYEAQETKPCVNVESHCSVYSGGGVASSTPMNCQITSVPDQVMPWGPPSRPPY